MTSEVELDLTLVQGSVYILGQLMEPKILDTPPKVVSDLVTATLLQFESV